MSERLLKGSRPIQEGANTEPKRDGPKVAERPLAPEEETEVINGARAAGAAKAGAEGSGAFR